MLSAILIACGLVAATAIVHVAGITVMLLALKRRHARAPTRFWPIARLLVVMTWCLILIHVAGILIWGLFYLWWGCLPDAETSFYFSGVTYATIGYGDVVLEKPWRILAPIEGLTGILMCGLSSGVFFAVVSHIFHSMHTNASENTTPADTPN